jgi:hypothetical protein
LDGDKPGEGEGKYTALMTENNLSSLMYDCLNAKLRNMHQKEILSMEK